VSSEPGQLVVEDLHTHFYTLAGEVKAVDGVSFELPRGESLGIVGESGCGKSVTAQSVMRIVPDPPGKVASGSIRFKGRELLTLSEAEMNKIRGNQIAMVYQEPMTSLNPAFTIGNQVGEVFRFHKGLPKKEAEQRAAEALRMVGIPDPHKRLLDYPHQLSGGMRQRVIIAMAIACDPDILIADEPTTAIDVTIQAQILDLILSLKERLGMSLMLITHDLGVVANIVKRVMVMYAGSVVETAGVEEIFSNPRHPYTRGLFTCIPRIGNRVKSLNEISGTVPNLLSLPRGCKFSNRCQEVMDICREQRPPLFKTGEDHHSRCWLEKA
jgi:oligopeptide/dipeptide ABC transporter ATP-binding protein